MIISVILLYLVLRTIDLENLKGIVTDFGAEYFVLFSLIYLSTFFIRAIRWQAVSAPIGRVRAADAVNYPQLKLWACLGG